MKLFTLSLVFMAIITCSMAVIINGRQVNRKPNLHYTPLAKRNGTITLSNSTLTQNRGLLTQRSNPAAPRRRLVRRRDCNKGNDTTSTSTNSDNKTTDNGNASNNNSSTNNTNGSTSKKIVNLAAKVDTDGTSKGDDESTSDNNDDDNDEEQTTSKSKSKSTSSSKSKSTSASSEGEFSGVITWYSPDNGACANGDYGEDDMVVALNAPQYGNIDKVSQYCSKCASVTGNKGTVVVKVVDACPECPEGNLDASKGAFDKITSGDGVGDITWSWVDC